MSEAFPAVHTPRRGSIDHEERLPQSQPSWSEATAVHVSGGSDVRARAKSSADLSSLPADVPKSPRRGVAYQALMIMCGVAVVSSFVAVIEEREFTQGLYMTLDALLNNGSGKYDEKCHWTQFLLCFCSLFGFFLFIDRCVGLLTSFDLGIPGSGAAHDMHELTAARLSAPIRLTRVMRVLSIWLAVMTSMVITYCADRGLIQPDDQADDLQDSPGTVLIAAILYAITTGCSGGFGHLNNDLVGAIYMTISVPTTTWLAAEVALYRRSIGYL